MSRDTPLQVGESATIVIAPDDLSAEITIQGQSQTVRGNSAKETRRIALDHVASYAAHIGRPIMVEARDSFSVQRLQALPGGVIRTVTETPALSRTRKPRGRRKLVIISAVSVLAVALSAAVGISIVRESSSSTVTQEKAPSIETVPFEARPAPAGFSTEALWRIPLTSGTRPAVAADGTRVAFIGADGRLAVAGPNGDRLWAADLPLKTDEIQGPLRFVDGQNGSRVAISGPSTLWIWPTGGGTPEEYELENGAQVTFAGTAPLVTNEDTAMLAEDGELIPVAVPKGSGGMLVHESTVLMAAAKGPWFWSTPDGDPRKVSAAKPADADALDRVITASENYVIVRWTGMADDHVILAVHDADDGSVFASTAIAAGELADARWIEGTRVAAYGPILVDLESGESQVLPGFSPLSATDSTLYGELGDDQVAVGADGEPTKMAQDAARPWGLLDGRAVVLADSNLYALSPK